MSSTVAPLDTLRLMALERHSLRVTLDLHAHTSAFRRELECIRKQVYENLLHLVAVHRLEACATGPRPSPQIH